MLESQPSKRSAFKGTVPWASTTGDTPWRRVMVPKQEGSPILGIHHGQWTPRPVLRHGSERFDGAAWHLSKMLEKTDKDKIKTMKSKNNDITAQWMKCIRWDLREGQMGMVRSTNPNVSTKLLMESQSTGGNPPLASGVHS